MKVKANLMMCDYSELEPFFDYCRQHCDTSSEYQVFTEGGEFVCNITLKAFNELKTKLQEQKNGN